MKRFFLIAGRIIVYVFAVAGFVLIAGFFAVKFHLTDVPGYVDNQSQTFQQLANTIDQAKDSASALTYDKNVSVDVINQYISDLVAVRAQKFNILCGIKNLAAYYPVNAHIIFNQYQKSYNDALAAKMIFSAKQQLNNSGQSLTDTCGTSSISEIEVAKTVASPTGKNLYPWMNDDEWTTISTAITKDKNDILRASEVAGIDPRFITANLAVEQLRLFHSQRELFEKFFKPLSILGNATKTSLGVMGIKEATAKDIERHLTDKNSPYYLGLGHEHDLDFSTNDPNTERYNRLTNEKNHYYSYLYGALYLKEILNQWKQAGYDIQSRPEIVGTLFNIGFSQSHPNDAPQVGGSQITIGNDKYSFGSLSFEFYYSGELSEDFPLVSY